MSSKVSKEQLVHLYHQYGYKYLKEYQESVLVFEIRQGGYNCVDIVSLNGGSPYEIKKDFESAGYATRLKCYETIDEASQVLFEDFFDSKSTLATLNRRYKKYIELQEKQLGVSYEYIPCPYRVDSDNENDANIIEYICSILDKSTPQLLIVEAAAGFGKTSTVYDLLNSILSDDKKHVPIFTELSKNRQAKIFRYVLLDEIDNIYPSLNSNLVQKEIRSGRIPVIVDGFDELLMKNDEHGMAEDEFDTVSAMLETIGELLETNAKIILTTRKTAIFSGDEFHEWIESKSNLFVTTKITLEKPNIKRWIGADKLSYLIDKSFPIRSLGSPVLLAYLKSLDLDEFYEICEDVNQVVVDHYFNALCEREKERQDLLIDNSLQLKIYQNLAKDFASYEITAESKDFISLLLLERNRETLNRVRQQYTIAQRPSLEELVETLCNHAFLDRIGGLDDKIGFANQFLFGTFLGECAISGGDEWLINSFAYEHYVTLTSLPFSVRSKEDRDALYSRVQLVEACIPAQEQLQFDILLKGSLHHSFIAESFEDLEIESTSFEHGVLKDCNFFSCTFRNCIFSANIIERVSFIYCSFEHCTVDGNNENIQFIECEDYDSGFISTFSLDTTSQKSTNISEHDEVEVKLIRKFIPSQRVNKYTKIRQRYLFKGFSPELQLLIPNVVKELVKKEFFYKKGEFLHMNTDSVDAICSYVEGIENGH